MSRRMKHFTFPFQRLSAAEAGCGDRGRCPKSGKLCILMSGRISWVSKQGCQRRLNEPRVSVRHDSSHPSSTTFSCERGNCLLFMWMDGGSSVRGTTRYFVVSKIALLAVRSHPEPREPRNGRRSFYDCRIYKGLSSA